jgi:hypothetical protein
VGCATAVGSLVDFELLEAVGLNLAVNIFGFESSSGCCEVGEDGIAGVSILDCLVGLRVTLKSTVAVLDTGREV